MLIRLGENCGQPGSSTPTTCTSMVCGDTAFPYDWALSCDLLNQPQAMDLQQGSFEHQAPLSAKPGVAGPALIYPSTDRKDVCVQAADSHRQRTPGSLGQRKGR